MLLPPDSEPANYQILDTLKVPQILDGAYTDWSQMYRAAKTVWINQRDQLESTAPRAVMPAPVGTAQPASTNMLLGLHDTTDLAITLAGLPGFAQTHRAVGPRRIAPDR